MKKELFSRVMIHEDSKKLDSISKQLPQFVPALNELKESYEKLKVGSFSNEIFKELISIGTKSIELRFNKQMEDKLSKAESIPEIIIDDMLERSKEKLNPLRSSLSKLRSFRPNVYSMSNVPQLSLDFISYADFSPVFFISESGEERILEKYCRIYLETEEEKDAFEALGDFCESYRKFLERTKVIRKDHFNGLNSLSDLIDETESPKVISKNFKSYFI